jgi:hypothetical protein
MKQNLLIYIILFSILFSLGGSYANANGSSSVINNGIASVEIVPEEKSGFTLINIDVYPNPAEDYIYVKMDNKSSEDVTLSVMSFIGNKMNTSSEKINNGLYKLNIRNIPSGHYYVLLSVGTEKHIKKFIKK